jgi:hypothetical protein
LDDGGQRGPGADDAGDGGDDSPAPACTTVDGGCGALASCGMRVAVLKVASSPPPSLGGAVADGTYVLTGFTLFTGALGGSGPTGAWFRQTIALTTLVDDAGAPGDAGSTQRMQWIEVTASDSSPTSLGTATATFAATSAMTLDYVCPSVTSQTARFSANTSELIVFIDHANGASTGRATFTRQ